MNSVGRGLGTWGDIVSHGVNPWRFKTAASSKQVAQGAEITQGTDAAVTTIDELAQDVKVTEETNG